MEGPWVGKIIRGNWSKGIEHRGLGPVCEVLLEWVGDVVLLNDPMVG